MKKICPLCESFAPQFYKDTQTYYRCPTCDAIFVSDTELPDATSEKERYELHDDDTADVGYRKFVSPITDGIRRSFTHEDKGLDFGAGTSAIISVVLKEHGYNIVNYDPYFHNHPELLQQKYDYISSCEVIEHFYHPKKEFTLLREMLKENGKLFLMTDVYDESIDFVKWYYKNDPTHVCFFCLQTMDYLAKRYNAELEVISKDIFIFKKSKERRHL